MFTGDKYNGLKNEINYYINNTCVSNVVVCMGAHANTFCMVIILRGSFKKKTISFRVYSIISF